MAENTQAANLGFEAKLFLAADKFKFVELNFFI